MRIAITGGIAEGKSTVRRMLAERGFATASADEVARELFAAPEVNARLAALMGAEPPITRAELAAAITVKPELRRRANGILHPLIAAEMRRIGAMFDEIPLLVETCRQGDYDFVWTVACSPEEKVRRLEERYGATGGLFTGIVRAQVSDAVRRCFADAVILTDGSLEDVERRVDSTLAEAGILPGPAAPR